MNLTRRMRQNRQLQRGFTLVEILVALSIGLFLIAGMLQLFSANNKTYRTQEAMSRLQENGRFAMQFLVRDLRQAGYRGCLSSLSTSSEAVLKDEVKIVHVLNST